MSVGEQIASVELDACCSSVVKRDEGHAVVVALKEMILCVDVLDGLAVGDKGLVGQTEASLNKLTADQCVLLRWEMHVGFSDVQRRRRSVLV